MFGAILGKFNQDESQEYQPDDAMDEDNSPVCPIYDFRSNIPDILRTEEVYFM